ncbi:protein maestro-like isoform X2 [Struthio camelus]|uniref:protein maestro-like n=1 Tax=Struthio camelus TaxID=8801 RepID=UPI003603D588
MAMRGVGNMASGAPTKLRRHRAAVMEVLCRGLEDAASTEVAAECLLALTKVLGRLKTRAMGSALEDISRSTRAFLGAEEEVLRFSAFALYGTLASSALGRRGGGPFSAEKWRRHFPASCCTSGAQPQPSPVRARSLCTSVPRFWGQRGCSNASLQVPG